MSRTELAFLKLRGGSEVCEMFAQLPTSSSSEQDELDEYQEAVARLSACFELKRNPVSGIMKFRAIDQKEGEKA